MESGPTELNERPRVLCLGVSYPSLAETLKAHGHDPHSRDWNTSAAPRSNKRRRRSASAEKNCLDKTFDETVEDILECARRKYLSAIDARDLARIVATQIHASVQIYTVSQEDAARYDTKRHLDANFNRSSFVKLLQKKFSGIQFDQVILDYFWIPPGWDKNHWKTSFFDNTLVNLARHDILKQPDPANSNDVIKEGAVFLPFCFHCFTEVLASKALLQHYNISFVRKGELGDVTLWAGTQRIDKASMQHVLGKHRDQEETYCTFGPSDVREASDNARIDKGEVLNILRRLEDFRDIRFIALRRLARGEDKGKLMGLAADASLVKRGFDCSRDAAQTTTPATPTISHARQKRRARTVTPTATLPSDSSGEEPTDQIGQWWKPKSRESNTTPRLNASGSNTIPRLNASGEQPANPKKRMRHMTQLSSAKGIVTPSTTQTQRRRSPRLHRVRLKDPLDGSEYNASPRRKLQFDLKSLTRS